MVRLHIRPEKDDLAGIKLTYLQVGGWADGSTRSLAGRMGQGEWAGGVAGWLGVRVDALRVLFVACVARPGHDGDDDGAPYLSYLILSLRHFIFIRPCMHAWAGGWGEWVGRRLVVVRRTGQFGAGVGSGWVGSGWARGGGHRFTRWGYGRQKGLCPQRASLSFVGGWLVGRRRKKQKYSKNRRANCNLSLPPSPPPPPPAHHTITRPWHENTPHRRCRICAAVSTW